MDVGICVLAENLNMSVHRRVDFVLHIGGSPGSIRACRIDESYRKLIEVIQNAGDRLTRGKGHCDFRFCVFGIQHLLFEFEALVTRRYPGKISSWRVTGCASSRTVEILFPGLGIPGLEVGGIDSLASSFSREQVILLRVDKSHQASNLRLRKGERW